MLKGTITAPDENGVSKIELKDTSESLLGVCAKMAVAAVVAVAGCIATYYTNKALDYLDNKKTKKTKKK